MFQRLSYSLLALALESFFVKTIFLVFHFFRKLQRKRNGHFSILFLLAPSLTAMDHMGASMYECVRVMSMYMMQFLPIYLTFLFMEEKIEQVTLHQFINLLP